MTPDEENEQFTAGVITSIGFAIRDSDMGVDIDELEPRMVCWAATASEDNRHLALDRVHREVTKMLVLRALEEADKVVGAIQQLFDL